jgi:phosphoglycolate phosphatase
MAGRTDPLIIRDACALHAVSDANARQAELLEQYFTCLAEELPRDVPGKCVLPGVVPLLEALRAESDTVVALLTGNLAISARLKLEQFDLWQYFQAGAFGDDAPERNGLVPVAAARVEALGYGPILPGHTVVVGDTPHDVACAGSAGARSLGVATGHSSVADLDAAGADAVFTDLSQTAQVLDVIKTLLDGRPANRG